MIDKLFVLINNKNLTMDSLLRNLTYTHANDEKDEGIKHLNYRVSKLEAEIYELKMIIKNNYKKRSTELVCGNKGSIHYKKRYSEIKEEMIETNYDFEAWCKRCPAKWINPE